MKLSDEMKKRLVDEIRFDLDFMKKTNKANEKLYYFSAMYGMAQRIMNLEFNAELCFLHQVMVLAYNMINARLSAIAAGQEGPISIPEEVFSSIEDTMKDLADSVDSGEEIYTQLQRLVNIGYVTTGNGYYLYLKGMLKI